MVQVLTCMLIDTHTDEVSVLWFPDHKLPSVDRFEAHEFPIEDFQWATSSLACPYV